MAPLSRDNKSLNAKHAAILKELVKIPDNKVCGDCKRNDARWASTNIGVFMCIRCSGIHRGMGVHISRVKSVDLDTWTPEQIANIQRWGNKKANLYWEAHLKAGHQPPEHKMESFIRSKYETKRWAMDGPIPDPDTLGDGPPHAPVEQSAPAVKAAPSKAASGSLDLLNDSAPAVAAPVKKAAAAPPAASSSNGLFDLDFGGSSAPSAAPAASAPRNNKADILSLFGQAPPAQPQQSAPTQSNAFSAAPSNAFAGLNLGSGGSSNPWGAAPPLAQPQQQSSSLFNSQDVWGAPASGGQDSFGDFGAPVAASKPKQPDAFGSLWD